MFELVVGIVRILITVIVELGIATQIFNIRDKKSIRTIIIVNIICQAFRNSYNNFMFIFIIVEIGLWLIKSFAYSIGCQYEYVRGTKMTRVAFVTNTATFFVDGFISGIIFGV